MYLLGILDANILVAKEGQMVPPGVRGASSRRGRDGYLAFVRAAWSAIDVDDALARNPSCNLSSSPQAEVLEEATSIREYQ